MISSRHLKRGEQGNIMLITIIIILILTIIVASCINISNQAFDLAILDRNTSNTYYLAKSAAEKQVDTINKSVEGALTDLVESLSKTYVGQVSTISSNTSGKLNQASGSHQSSYNLYKNIGYDAGNLKITSSQLQNDLQVKVYDYIKTHYIGDSTSPKHITYDVASDRKENGYKTTVTMYLKEKNPVPTLPADKTAFNLEVEAVTKKGIEVYDRQKVIAEVKIEVPSDIRNQLIARYQWAFDAPEVLKGALTCFSDVVVDQGELIVNGDIYVKGGKKVSKVHAATGNVVDGTNTEFPDPEQSGGVIANKGGKITVNTLSSGEGGSIYCDSNVIVSDGWGDASCTRNNNSQINVAGSVIAHTVGIVDDFYEDSINQVPYSATGQVKNALITINKDALVDNDVMIDRWVTDSEIDISGMIFGISDGSDLGSYKDTAGNNITLADPNTSSGVFSQGENSFITAHKGIIVAGQPFITLSSSQLPLKLWESVGEPFNGIASWAGYPEGKDEVANKSYLDATSPFLSLIKRNKVRTELGATHFFAPAQISINDTIQPNGTDFGNEGEAKQFFRTQAVGSKTMSGCGAIGSYEESLLDADTIKSFYKGELVGANPWAHGKIFTTGALPVEYHGVQGYMTAVRSVFYKGFNGDVLQTLKFNDVVKLDDVDGVNTMAGTPPVADATKLYENPIICFENGGEVDISTLYIDEGTQTGTTSPWPTIIINKGTDPLILTASSGNELKGIIISKGPVEIQSDMTITGSVIIGGPEDSSLTAKEIMTGDNSGLHLAAGVTATITSDKDMLLKVKTNQLKNYHQVLEALHLAKFPTGAGIADIESGKAMSEAYGPYTGAVSYKVGKIFLTSKSYLVVDTEAIAVSLTKLYREG